MTNREADHYYRIRGEIEERTESRPNPTPAERAAARETLRRKCAELGITLKPDETAPDKTEDESDGWNH